LVVIFYLGTSVGAQVTGGDHSQSDTFNSGSFLKDNPVPPTAEQDNTNFEDDDSFIYDEQDFFSRNRLQKKLPPLNNQEKIKWAFRTADSNVYQ